VSAFLVRSFVRLDARSFVPTRTTVTAARAGAVKDARLSNGILNNELYHGTIVDDRQRFIKDPDIGKRVARENPESEWQRQSVPHLCVIDDEIWDAVQRRRAERGGPHLYQRRRPRRPLSGLIYCGGCGSRYIVATHEYLRCSGRVNSGICDCSRTIEMREVEQRVLGALRRNLLASDVVADAVETYRRERMRLAAERRQSRGRLESDLADVERKINRMLKMVGDGMLNLPSLAHGLTSLR
jgi:site-specific DNA recombinase